MHRTKKRPAMALLLLCVVAAGCSLQIGPRMVRGARFNYNEAIARSRDEQMLLNLVRLRYRDTPTFLELTSVVTQYNLEGSASFSPTFDVAGVTGNDEYGAGVSASYRENPTISYSPLSGEDFARRVLTPIPPAALVLLSDTGWSLERLMLCCVERVGSLNNARGAAGPTPDYEPEYRSFQRAASLMRRMQLRQLLDARAETAGDKTIVWFDVGTPGDAADAALVAEFREMFGLGPDDRTVRVVQRTTVPSSHEIALETRSLLGTLFYLSQGVEPPGEHEEEGLVTRTLDAAGEPVDWVGVIGGVLRIRSTTRRPDRAAIAVRYREHWFYVDDADLDSKTTFTLLTYLFALQASDAKAITPLLTLPAGG